MDNLNGIVAFVRTAETLSFVAAARKLRDECRWRRDRAPKERAVAEDARNDCDVAEAELAALAA